MYFVGRGIITNRRKCSYRRELLCFFLFCLIRLIRLIRFMDFFLFCSGFIVFRIVAKIGPTFVTENCQVM